jgi:hypothetical protein
MLPEQLSLTLGSTKSPINDSSNTYKKGRHFMTDY